MTARASLEPDLIVDLVDLAAACAAADEDPRQRRADVVYIIRQLIGHFEHAFAGLAEARADQYAAEAAAFRGTPGESTMRSAYRDVTDDSAVTSFRDLVAKYNARGFAVAEFTPEVRALTTSGDTVPSTFHDRLTIYERGAYLPAPVGCISHGGTVTAEAGVINAFDPTIGSATATPYKYAAITQWSSELDTDNVINLETAIAFSTGRELALDIGVHLTTGDGSSKPTGWITNATNAGTATGGTATQGFDYYAPSDLPALFMAVAKPYRQRGIWQASSTMYQKILEWRDSDGVPIALPLNDSPSGLGIYGRPLVENPALAAVGSATKSIGFGDFGRFEVVRLPVRVELSRDATIGGTSLFQTDQVAIRVIERVDGRLVDTAAVAYQVAANS